MLMAVGMGLTMAPATDSVMGSLPLAKAGVGSAVNDTTRQVGGALGVAVIGSVLATTYGDKISQLLRRHARAERGRRRHQQQHRRRADRRPAAHRERPRRGRRPAAGRWPTRPSSTPCTGASSSRPSPPAIGVVVALVFLPARARPEDREEQIQEYAEEHTGEFQVPGPRPGSAAPPPPADARPPEPDVTADRHAGRRSGGPAAPRPTTPSPAPRSPCWPRPGSRGSRSRPSPSGPASPAPPSTAATRASPSCSSPCWPTPAGPRSTTPTPAPSSATSTRVAEGLHRALTSTDLGRALPAVIAAAAQHPDVAAAHRAFVASRRRVALAAVARGIERGEVDPEVDPDTLVDLVVGPVFHRRFMSRRPVAEAWIREIVTRAVRGCAPTGVPSRRGLNGE